jgi:hyperosmotically inducible periplasmic protein
MNARFRFAAPLALALSLASIAPAFAAGNGSDQPVTDTWITTKVKSELATTDGVKSTKISVTTVDGTVTLTGTLASEMAVEKAVAAAKSVKGVKTVDSSGLKAGPKS